ncbi:MAG: FlgD immunoglobulin-like domain containing protein, partial [bacterium]
PPTSGGVWWHHDAANRRLIVQYDSMPYYSSRNVYEWFQVVIYDTTLAAPDGNSVFTYQYLTANGYGSTTTGINDSTTAIGIECLFDGAYHRGSAPIVAGRAIKFTTDGPVVGAKEPNAGIGSVAAGLALQVTPNPFRQAAALRWQLPAAGRVRLVVYDVGGRVIRTLVDAEMTAGTYLSSWDGRDEKGGEVANGTYLYKLETPTGIRTAKAVVLR